MYRLFVSSIITSLLTAAAVRAAPVDSSSTSSSDSNAYPRIALNSEQDFCLFLPPQPGLVVAINEDNGIPFCTKPDTVYNSTVFPEGFITTAHYLKNTSYVQVTGFFNRDKYSLGATDGGGQYDNHNGGKPVGAECENYNYFVSMIEPDINRFCIRCCQEEEDCNTGRSGYGCLRIIDGDYTDDNNYINSNSSSNDTTTTSHLNTNMNSVLAELNTFPSTSEGDDTTTEDDNDTNTEDNEATTTTTDGDANEAIAAEIETLKTNQYSSAEEIQTEWTSFTSKLSNQYPEISEQINQLSSLTSSLTTVDQWNNFFDLVSEKIISLQQTTTSESEATKTHTNTKEDLDWLFSHRNDHDNQATW